MPGSVALRNLEAETALPARRLLGHQLAGNTLPAHLALPDPAPSHPLRKLRTQAQKELPAQRRGRWSARFGGGPPEPAEFCVRLSGVTNSG